MAKGSLDGLITHLRGLIRARPGEELTDGQLLERFASFREEDSFAALVRRHGGLVLGVCRRILRDAHDAEDAFQATFLVLARKADSIRKHESVGSWLYGVACRIAFKARGKAARRQALAPDPVLPVSEDPLAEVMWRELRPVLDEELGRLPEKYRAPIVLCYLENKTNVEAARQLGWTKGTVSGRLARARELLRSRLARRGLALSAGLVVAALSQNTAAAVPAALGGSTVRAAVLFTTHPAAAGAVSAPVTALAKGVLQAMAISKLKVLTALVLALGILTGGTALLTFPARADKGDAKAASSAKGVKGDREKLQGTWLAVSVTNSGHQAPAEVVKQFRLVIKGDRIQLHAPGEERTSTFKLDPGKSPRWIDISPLDGPAKGQLVPGIYALKGDRLTLCANNGKEKPRPKEFASPENSGLVLLVLRRQKTASDDSNKGDEDNERLRAENAKLKNEVARLRAEVVRLKVMMDRMSLEAKVQAQVAQANKERAEAARLEAQRARRQAERALDQLQAQRKAAEEQAARARAEARKALEEARKAEAEARKRVEEENKKKQEQEKKKDKNPE